MKKIFLSGSGGAIGKNFVEKFSTQYQIDASLRKILDLSKSEALAKHFDRLGEIDCILNAANVGGTRNSVKSEQDCLFESMMIFRNVFQEACHAKRFIQFGSGAEYGKPFLKPNMHEEEAGIYLPKDAYGLAKFFAGQLLERQTPGKYVNLRIFGVFGPYEDYRVRFISNAIVRSLLGLPIVVNQNAIFDYVYMDDFLRILNYFIENPAPYVTYNITAGTPVSLIELGQIVHKLTNNRHALIIKNDSIKEYYTGDNTRLKQFLPADFVFTPPEHAISTLISWYGEYIKRMNHEELINLI